MKRYIKEIDGKNVIKTGNRIVIVKDGRQYINPSEEMILADGWVEYVPPTRPEPTEEELLERARQRKLNALHEYDESKEVNNCVVVYQGQELDYWADRYERDSLKGTLRDCIAMGRETYRLDLRDKGVSIVAPCQTLLQLMAALEVYAVDCYNKTTDHEFALNALSTETEIEAYEFTGYPAQPRFEFA